MRKLVLAVAILVAGSAAKPSTAHAEVGIGIFLFQPTGIDIKLGLGSRSALDIVGGVSDIRADDGYVHLTYLVTPFIAHGGGDLLVPFRLGIGGAVFGFNGDVGAAVRVPLEVGFRFLRPDIEIYGEITFRIVFRDDNNNNNDNVFFDLDGGIGFRFYF